MHEHGLPDIVIVNDEPSGLPPVAVRPPHAHDSGHDGDDRRSPSRPITNSNGRTHEHDSKENPMNNEIRKFDFRGASLRTLTDEAGEPWFVAKDVCDILEISNPSDALKRLDDDERSRFNLGRQGETNIVNEAGLYVLVLGSRKPEAHEFKRWVTHEVLPQIRKTGGYIPATDADDDMTILAKAVMIGQRTMEAQKRKIASQQSRIVELEPKARFADAVAASDGTCLVGELAKMLRQNGMDIGQNRLFRLLQADGYLGKSGSNRNVPTQRAMELGLFRIKETTVTHADGHTTVSRTPKVTGKGQRYFIDRYWGRAQPSLEAGA
jgi:anti-repressor protein